MIYQPDNLDAPPGRDLRLARTRRLSILEGAAWALMFGFGDSYLAPFALLAGAGNHAMAFLGTASLVIGAVAQLAGAVLTERLGHRKPLLIATSAAHALSFVPLVAIALIAPDRAVWLVLSIGVLLAWLGSFGNPAWTSWMGDVTDPATRGRFFALRGVILMIATVVAMLSAASVLTLFRGVGRTWVGFACLFAVAAVARGYCSWLFRRHDEPALSRRTDAYFSFWDYIRRVRHSNFTRFSFAVALMNGSVSVAGPFFTVYMLRDLQWSYMRFTLSTVVFLLAQSVVYRWWGAICDRHGTRAVLKATSVLLPLLPLPWVLSTSTPVLFAAQIVSGVTWAGFNLASTNFLYDAVTPPKRARIVSYHGLLNAACVLIGASAVGAPIAEYVPASFAMGPVQVTMLSSLPVVFIASSLLRILAAAFMLPRFREVRPAEPVRTADLLFRLGSGEPFLSAGMELVQRLPLLGRLFPVDAPRPGGHSHPER